MGSYRFRFDVVASNLDFLLGGLGNTLLISSVALVLSLIGGLVIALLGMAPSRLARALAFGFGELVRNTPILVQLLYVYYVVPILTGLKVSSFNAILVGLSVYSSAFIAEVYRAGIAAVPRGHREAAQVLGLGPVQTFRRIVLPQAVRIVLPPLASNFVILIKYSSLASIISVGEITRRAIELQSSTFRPLEIFSFVAVVYFCICFPLSVGIRLWERRLATL